MSIWIVQHEQKWHGAPFLHCAGIGPGAAWDPYMNTPCHSGPKAEGFRTLGCLEAESAQWGSRYPPSDWSIITEAIICVNRHISEPIKWIWKLTAPPQNLWRLPMWPWGLNPESSISAQVLMRTVLLCPRFDFYAQKTPWGGILQHKWS